jgi:hypothetical protein
MNCSNLPARHQRAPVSSPGSSTSRQGRPSLALSSAIFCAAVRLIEFVPLPRANMSCRPGGKLGLQWNILGSS